MKLQNTAATLGLSALIAIGAIATAPAVHAFGLDSIKSVAGGDSGSAAIDVDSLVSEQKDLMGRFNLAMNNMLMAQSRVLAAGNMKEYADMAAASAANYSTGNVVAKDQLERDTALTSENNARIEAMLKQGNALTDEGRKLLATAVPHYAKGLYEGTKLPGAFSKWTDSAKGGVASLKSNPMKLAPLQKSLGEATTVATNLPALVKAWGATSRDFIAYAKSNKVDVSDVESQLGDL